MWCRHCHQEVAARPDQISERPICPRCRSFLGATQRDRAGLAGCHPLDDRTLHVKTISRSSQESLRPPIDPPTPGEKRPTPRKQSSATAETANHLNQLDDELQNAKQRLAALETKSWRVDTPHEFATDARADSQVNSDEPRPSPRHDADAARLSIESPTATSVDHRIETLKMVLHEERKRQIHLVWSTALALTFVIMISGLGIAVGQARNALLVAIILMSTVTFVLATWSYALTRQANREQFEDASASPEARDRHAARPPQSGRRRAPSVTP